MSLWKMIIFMKLSRGNFLTVSSDWLGGPWKVVLYYLASAESSITIKRTADADFPNGLDFFRPENSGVELNKKH